MSGSLSLESEPDVVLRAKSPICAWLQSCIRTSPCSGWAFGRTPQQGQCLRWAAPVQIDAQRNPAMTATVEALHDSSFASGYTTHDVLNQPGALADYNAFSADKPLVDAMRAFGADWARDKLDRAGALVGNEKVQYVARQAKRRRNDLRWTRSVAARQPFIHVRDRACRGGPGRLIHPSRPPIRSDHVDRISGREFAHLSRCRHGRDHCWLSLFRYWRREENSPPRGVWAPVDSVGIQTEMKLR
jgi:hypothetical protein